MRFIKQYNQQACYKSLSDCMFIVNKPDSLFDMKCLLEQSPGKITASY